MLQKYGFFLNKGHSSPIVFHYFFLHIPFFGFRDENPKIIRIFAEMPANGVANPNRCNYNRS